MNFRRSHLRKTSLLLVFCRCSNRCLFSQLFKQVHRLVKNKTFESDFFPDYTPQKVVINSFSLRYWTWMLRPSKFPPFSTWLIHNATLSLFNYFTFLDWINSLTSCGEASVTCLAVWSLNWRRLASNEVLAFDQWDDGTDQLEEVYLIQVFVLPGVMNI